MTSADLSLQLSHCGREVEHQPGDVLQLVLQDLDGICLLLVLERTHGGGELSSAGRYFRLHVICVEHRVCLREPTCSWAMREVFCSLMMVLLNAFCISSICLRYLELHSGAEFVDKNV